MNARLQQRAARREIPCGHGGCSASRHVRWARVARLVALWSTVASAAAGEGRLQLTTTGAAEVEGVRLVEAPSARWVSVRARGAGRLALLSVLAPEERADAAHPSFLTALDLASAPLVIPPGGVPVECRGGARRSIALVEDEAGGRTLALERSAVLPGGMLAAWLVGQGLAAPARPVDGTATVLVAVFASTAESAWSAPLRVAQSDGGAAEDLATLAADGVRAEAVLWMVTDTSMRWRGVSERRTAGLGVTWLAAAGRSDYLLRARGVTAGGTDWILEGDARHVVAPEAVRELGVVSSLVEEVLAEEASCLRRIDALATDRPVGRACAPGTLGTGGSADCEERTMAGEVPAADYRCGERQDLAHLLAGTVPETVRVVRWRGRLESTTPRDLALSRGSADDWEVSRVVESAQLDLLGCVREYGGSGGASGAGAGGWNGAGGDRPRLPLEPPAPEVPVEPTWHCEIVHEGSCSGTSDSDGGSCDGDGSDAGETCDGDSSSSGGDSCDGDSSSSGGDSCDGDSSGYDGDTCSGDSSGYDGDTCSGDSSDSCSGGSSDCRTGRARARVRPTQALMALAALALALRRHSRPARPGAAGR